MQGGKKPTRATARKAGLLEELLAQPNTYQKSQPPSWLCTTTAGYCWESRAQKISPSGSTCFQTELGKIQMGSASCERNSSICTSFKGTARDRAGLRSCSSVSHSPREPKGRSHLHTKGTDCSISNQIPWNERFPARTTKLIEICSCKTQGARL